MQLHKHTRTRIEKGGWKYNLLEFILNLLQVLDRENELTVNVIGILRDLRFFFPCQPTFLTLNFLGKVRETASSAMRRFIGTRDRDRLKGFQREYKVALVVIYTKGSQKEFLKSLCIVSLYLSVVARGWECGTPTS